MLLPEDFGIRVDYDENGLIIEVTHKPTGQIRAARPTNKESVGAVQQRLITEIKEQFPAPKDFRVEYQFVRDESGNGGTAVVISHLPSGTSRYFPSGSPQVDVKQAIDEIVSELWHEARL